MCLPHFILIPLPATSSNHVCLSVLLKPCLAGDGAINQLSPRSPVGVGLGLQLPWSPHWSQGPFCPEAVPLPSVFLVSSILLVSYFHKRWGAVGYLLCALVDRLGVSPECRGKWTLLPPISMPSFSPNHFYLTFLNVQFSSCKCIHIVVQ